MFGIKNFLSSVTGVFVILLLLAASGTGIRAQTVESIEWQAVAGGVDGAPVVRLVFEPTPNPPRYLGEGTAIDWARPGLTLELLTLVAERLGIVFSYQRYPWKRALFLLKTNQVDGVFHASFVLERMRFGVYPMRDGAVDPSRQVFEQSYVFYTVSDRAFGWDGETVQGVGLPVGATTGYSIIRTLERMGLPIEQAPSKAENLRKLVGGRLSAVADLENMTDIFIRDRPEQFRSVRKVMPPIVQKPYYLMLSHGFYQGHRDLAEAIWDQIALVNASEAFAAIRADYAN